MKLWPQIAQILVERAGSVKEAAARVGMTPSMVSIMLHGRAVPHPRRFDALARETGLDREALLAAWINDQAFERFGVDAVQFMRAKRALVKQLSRANG